MSRHIGSWNAEFDDLRKPIDAFNRRQSRRDILIRSNGKIRWQAFEVRLQARSSPWAVASCAEALKGSLPLAGVGRGNGGSGRMPLTLLLHVLLRACLMQTGEIGYKIVSTPIAKQESIRGHDRSAADFMRVKEVGLEP